MMKKFSDWFFAPDPMMVGWIPFFGVLLPMGVMLQYVFGLEDVIPPIWPNGLIAFSVAAIFALRAKEWRMLAMSIFMGVAISPVAFLGAKVINQVLSVFFPGLV